jgi:hypothetical protein
LWTGTPKKVLDFPGIKTQEFADVGFANLKKNAWPPVLFTYLLSSFGLFYRHKP